MAAEVAAQVHSPPYGLVSLDPTLPEGERHLVAMSEAVPLSGPRRADRDGPVDAGRPDEDARLLLQPAERPPGRVPADRRAGHGRALRVRVPVPAEHADAPAVDQLDRPRRDRHGSLGGAGLVHRQADPARGGELEADAARTAASPLRLAINFTPASLLDSQFEAEGARRDGQRRRPLAAPDHARVHRAAGRLGRRPAR